MKVQEKRAILEDIKSSFGVAGSRFNGVVDDIVLVLQKWATIMQDMEKANSKLGQTSQPYSYCARHKVRPAPGKYCHKCEEEIRKSERAKIANSITRPDDPDDSDSD